MSDQPVACRRCHTRFDPADTRFDGSAESSIAGFCKACVDRCHESTEFDHSCPVCAPPGERPMEMAHWGLW